MNIVVLDISGKVDNYSSYLCEALDKTFDKKSIVTFLNTKVIDGFNGRFQKLLNLVPRKYWYCEYKWKRIIKAIEGIINYFFVTYYVRRHKVDIVHLQWLPFMEHISIEDFFVRLIRGKNHKRKIVYTHHNLYPHKSSEIEKESYRKRFERIKPYIDAYIVHTDVDRIKLHKEFSIPIDKINVALHGVFVPREAIYSPVQHKGGKLNFLMFGAQTGYKGTDIFIEAINRIPKEEREKMSFTIMGLTDLPLFDKYKGMADSLNIRWTPTTVSNAELHTTINESDVVVFPYRSISQSGALLLTIYFEKYIIASDLQSFKETLTGFNNQWFFHTEDIDGLANQMMLYLDETNFEGEKEIIKDIKKANSWEVSAKSTIEVYNKVLTQQE